VRFGMCKIIAPLLLLAASAVQAQLWSGPAAVEVRVEDEKGLPVAGASLALQFNGVDPKEGPPPVLTDSRGKATVGGLAEGSWHLEVSHGGFMTYLAEITVREKGRLVLDEAAQFNVVGATRMMRVQISRAKSAPVPRPSAVAEKAPAPVRPPVTAAPAAPQPEPAAPAAPAPAPEKPAPAPTPEPPMAKPSTSPAPAAVPATPVPQPQNPPAPAPPQQKPPAPPAPEAPMAKPVTPPAPAPPAAAVPTPQPAVPTAPPAPPTPDPVRLRTSQDRTCFECPPGESALSTERVVPPGGGSGCGADIAAQLRNGEIPSSLPAGCHVLRLALPAGTRYTGYRYEVQAGGDSLDCLAGQSCPQSTGRWPIDPVLIRRPEGTIVLAPFEAGPAERERRAVFTAYFTTGTAKRR